MNRFLCIDMINFILLIMLYLLNSPLTLAASIINKTDSENITKKKVEMLEFLMKRLKVIDWQYGPITMSTFNLEGIEINYPILERYEIDELKDIIVDNKRIKKKNIFCNLGISCHKSPLVNKDSFSKNLSYGEDLYLMLKHYYQYEILVDNIDDEGKVRKLKKWGEILIKKMKVMHPAISW